MDIITMLTEASSILGVMNTAYTFFSQVGIMAVGMALGFAGVAICVYKKSDEDDDEEEDELPYEQKYYDEFHYMETRELSKSQLSELMTKFLVEKTPSGDVVMSYCDESGTFQYWCDDRNVKFMVLDAVAQKYAIDNDAKVICNDYKEEYEVAAKAVQDTNKERNKEPNKELNKEPNQNIVSSVFAKFKSYNTASEKTKVDAKTNSVILTEKCNRFKRRGNVAEWVTDMKYKEEATCEQKMSITEWLTNRRTLANSLPEPEN